MLKSKFVKVSVAALVVAGLSASVASGVMAHGKRGGMIAKICSPQAEQMMEQRSAKLQEALNLTAEQQVLFDAMQTQKSAAMETARTFCDKVTEGERPSKEVRKEIRTAMKQFKEQGEDTREAFRDSLSDDQKKEMRKLRKEARKDKRSKKYSDNN